MGKQKREVWDYLMDIDYGVCLGQVDRINQVWVKEKRILCGNYSERVDVDVNLPDLFGGDDGEGGPKGTVEIYVGDSDQLASASLSGRYDLTPATMPGYRGLCHLFFRGSGSKSKGFRWTSMNPYLPAAKVSVTDIAWGLGVPYAEIPASIGTNADGTLISADPYLDGPPTLNSLLPVARFDGETLPDPDDDDITTRVYLAEIGITSGDLALSLEQIPDAVWEAHMSMSWASSGQVDYALELRVGLLTGEEIVTTLERTGEDLDVTQVVPLPEDTAWLEARCAKDGYVFGDTVQVRLILGVGEGAAPLTYPGYVSGIGSWEDQPGDTYTLGLGADDYATVGMNLTFDTNGSVVATLAGRAFDAEGNDLNWLDGESDQEQVSVSANTHGSLTWTRRAPPGTDKIEIRGFITPFIPLFTDLTNIQTSAYMSLGWRTAGWCPTDGTGLDLLPDANPASMIYECLTDTDWGLGEDPASVGTSLAAAAKTLYDEKFGLSMGFFQQADVESFIQEVLDHIKGALFRDPATGLWELILFRDDYDSATLDLWDETNCIATNRKRVAWGETTNQVVVTYTNPEDETEATVTAHDLANIQIQAGISSDSRNYYGVRNPYLAQVLAERDVRETAAPLFSATLLVDRSAWAITPGSVRRFSWDEDSISEMVVRVMSVDYGKPSDRKIKVQVVEDIFAFEKTQYAGPQTSQWAVSAAPRTLPAQAALTLPLGTLIEDGYTIEEIDASPGSVKVGFLGDDDDQAILDIQAHTDVTAANGSTVTQAVATFPASLSDTLRAALVAEASSEIEGDLIEGLFNETPEPGALLMLGDQESGSEIIMLDTYDSVGDTWSVMRGVWDTVPGAWPEGSRLWSFSTGGSASDPVERAAGEDVTYRLLPRNSQSRLAYSAATALDIQTTDRPHMPFRPAAVQLDGAGFEAVSYTDTATQPVSVTATWANRNRTVEDSVAFRWLDAGTTGETGQTVTLRIVDLLGNVSSEITGLAGESHDIPFASLAAVGAGYVEFFSSRDGIESWTGARRAFDAGSGWGTAWGVGWGGPT